MRLAGKIMKPQLPTRWNLTPRQALRLQESLRARVILDDRFGPVRTVAGADLAFDPATETAFAGVIVYRFPQMEELERQMGSARLRFPYVPGLLSFRESPILLRAFARLKTEPDLILIDGHGLAHPRRFGIACHLGVLFDKPTIGCAKSVLVGDFAEPGRRAGSASPLIHAGEQVGVALRTRDSVRPIFVTQGHRVSLGSAVELVSRCLDGFRIPKPTREADHYVRELRLRYQAAGSPVSRPR
jgi:deoxyribonuclease V